MHVGEIGLGWIHRVGQTCWSDHMRSVLQKTFSHVLDHSQSDLYDLVAGPDQLVGSRGVVPVGLFSIIM